jgi:hypothetical protein
MKTKTKERFVTVRSEGGLLPLDFLEKIASLANEVGGVTPEAYHLFEREKINEAINRAWDRLLGCWISFRIATKDADPNDPLMRETRERWLLPLFDALGYGRLVASKVVEIDGKAFPISHFWHNAPIHLVGSGVELDRRTSGVAGAAKSTPHGMIQEFLNQSDQHLWAFLSNGKKFRILRDNMSLTRQSYVEFDLEGMMDGELFSDFRLLWLVCHQSRIEADTPENCWLEKWCKTALESGIRVRDQLRAGVEQAIQLIGTGLLQQAANSTLRTSLKSRELSSIDYYRQILRAIYRLLFLFVAEDRKLLLPEGSSIAAQKTYIDFYSTQHTRTLAGSIRGSEHTDLWQAQSVVFSAISNNDGYPGLALPGLGSFLWSSLAVTNIETCSLSNRVFLSALRVLAFVEEGKARRTVDFKNLRSEELGSIYEALLEMHPRVDLATHQFTLMGATGSERKTTGSYYTPAGLVASLLDTALDPILRQFANSTSAKHDLLSLSVCDPACGSGHFLIAAAHRIAKALASARSEDAEPSPEAYRTALRDVISNCIYGVDVNEMSVELCKVSLWLESLEPGKPFSFLEHKIKCGNSLIGTTPKLLQKSIPDQAFDIIYGDDKDFAKTTRAANKAQSPGQLSIGEGLDRSEAWFKLSETLSELNSLPDNSAAELLAKQAKHDQIVTGELYQRERFICDAWCASFVWKLAPGSLPPITRTTFTTLSNDDKKIPQEVRAEVERLRDQFKFFHWHVEFPHIFSVQNCQDPENECMGWSGGFDVMLGNPPWERINIKEKEWFAARSPEIAQASNATKRKQLIKSLETENPSLFYEYREEYRKAEGESHFLRKSGRYPLCGCGDVNTYAVFAETYFNLVRSSGRSGFIVQSDIATGDTYKAFFSQVMRTRQLISFYDFVNTEGLFPHVHRTHPHFCLITIGGSGIDEEPDFAFWNTNPAHLLEPNRHIRLTYEDISLLNPNTGTCAVFRSRYDADIVKEIYRRVPIILGESAASQHEWEIDMGRMFHMSDDSDIFRTAQTFPAQAAKDGNLFTYADNNGSLKRFLPLYESKMIHLFDDRWGTYEGEEVRNVSLLEKQDPKFSIDPRYWVPEEAVLEKLEGRWKRPWLLGFRKITNSTNERTSIATLFPLCGVGDSMSLVYMGEKHRHLSLLFAANLCSFAFDFVTRVKQSGTNLALFIFKQLPVISPSTFESQCPWHRTTTLAEWMMPKCLSLFLTTREMVRCLHEFGSGSVSPCWNESERFLLRCELDAAFFHLYGLTRDEVLYIMDTFNVIKHSDERMFGDFRTLRLVVALFDAMRSSADPEGAPYDRHRSANALAATTMSS